MRTAVDLLLRNVTLPTGRCADIAVADGIVRHVGAPLPAYEAVDCSRLLCLPAAIDMHVHMRGGGQSYKEDWASGSRSAVAGGVTIVVDQPNTVPPITTPDLVRARVREAMEHAVCGFAVNAGVTPGADLEEMWRAGTLAFGEIFTAPSSYGDALDSAALEQALVRIRRLGGLAAIHAEEVPGGRAATLAGHDVARSADGEVRAVEAVQELAPPGMRLHICHASTAATVDAARGTVEVAPHHLFLSRESFPEDDARAKVNPPLRDEKTRRELWSRWNRIDAVASDHAPHTLAEKSAGFAAAPSGIPGVETMVPLLVAAARRRRIPLVSVMEKTSWNPASILGIPRAGFEPGDRADFALYPDSVMRVDPDCLHSRCGWSPFEGCEAVFPEEVVIQGVRVYRDGDVLDARPRWYPGQGYILSEKK